MDGKPSNQGDGDLFLGGHSGKGHGGLPPLPKGQIAQDGQTVFCQKHGPLKPNLSTTSLMTSPESPKVTSWASMQNLRQSLLHNNATPSVNLGGREHTDAVRHYCLLGKFMHSLWKRERCCDVTLVVGQTRFLAHRFALMAHSSFFQSKLGSRKLEKVNLEVCLDPLGISSEVCGIILEFIYTGKADKVTATNVGAVVSSSRFLGISGLDRMAEQVLWNMSPNPVRNTLHVIEICVKHNLDDLKEQAMHNHAENFGDLFSTPEFMELSLDRVTSILDSDVMYIDGERDVFFTVVNWIDHDVKNREAQAEHVLKLVRFFLMSEEDLFECAQFINGKSGVWSSRLYQTMLNKILHAHWTRACQSRKKMDLAEASMTCLNKLDPRRFNSKSNLIEQ